MGLIAAGRCQHYAINDLNFCDASISYSFGVVLWELLTGREPWAGFKPLQIMHMVAQMGKRLLIPDVLPHGQLSLTTRQPHAPQMFQTAPGHVSCHPPQVALSIYRV